MSTAFLTGPQRRAKLARSTNNHAAEVGDTDDGPATVEVNLTISRSQFLRLAHLANVNAAQNTFLRPDCGVPALILSVLNSLDQAICRPGSWERDCFYRLFGESLDVACGAMYASADAPKSSIGGAA